MTLNAELNLVLGLSSGKELVAKRVMLFPETDIQQIFALRAKAQNEMGGFSTGLGFWGSPGWVIGGAAVLGLAESLISNSKMKDGLAILQQVAAKAEHLKSKGKFFDVAEIEGIQWARPGDWRAIQIQQSEMIRPSLGTIGSYAGKFVRAVVKDGDIPEVETNRMTETNRLGFIHDDNDFITFEVRGEAVAVRWDTIERYQLIQNAQTVSPESKEVDRTLSSSRAALPRLDRQSPFMGDKENSSFGRRGP
ncbi:MAG TPA: hypothetical protein VK512_03235 [Xanthobacteraceae bacterium]|nr:hypothetical protein [Xanthobacteraceae bacterium]